MDQWGWGLWIRQIYFVTVLYLLQMGKQARIYMSQAVVAPPSEPARQANLNEHTHIGILDQALCLILIFVQKSYAKIMPKGA